VPSTLLRFLARRLLRAFVLVLVVASAALVLVHVAPGDAFTEIGVDAQVAAAERQRLGLDRPFVAQYADWVARAATLDFGESTRFRRPVSTLVAERVGNTVRLGIVALVLALGLGIPAGVRTGSSPDRWTSRAIAGTSLLLVSVPPLVTSLVLLLIAARTGTLPAAGVTQWQHVLLPALALGLPIAASLERIQSRATAEAMQDPSIIAARARGLSLARVTWVHAFRLSLTPVLGVLGIVVGTVFSGSFVVEIVMSWPGLGDLMHQALIGRDTFLAAGCAAAGSVFLALGLLIADVALAANDPRIGDVA
jgi:peptide/nickel transport system permease protein